MYFVSYTANSSDVKLTIIVPVVFEMQGNFEKFIYRANHSYWVTCMLYYFYTYIEPAELW